MKFGGGVLFVKSGPFLSAGCIMYSLSIFYFTFYFLGGAYEPNAPPACGPDYYYYTRLMASFP